MIWKVFLTSTDYKLPSVYVSILPQEDGLCWQWWKWLQWCCVEVNKNVLLAYIRMLICRTPNNLWISPSFRYLLLPSITNSLIPLFKLHCTRKVFVGEHTTINMQLTVFAFKISCFIKWKAFDASITNDRKE